MVLYRLRSAYIYYTGKKSAIGQAVGCDFVSPVLKSKSFKAQHNKRVHVMCAHARQGRENFGCFLVLLQYCIIYSSGMDSCMSDQLQWLSEWFPWTTFNILHLSYWSKHRKVQTNAYFNIDTQYAHFLGNPLYHATKLHLNNRVFAACPHTKICIPCIKKVGFLKVFFFLSVTLVWKLYHNQW